jgi:hypothetical protein
MMRSGWRGRLWVWASLVHGYWANGLPHVIGSDGPLESASELVSSTHY